MVGGEEDTGQGPGSNRRCRTYRLRGGRNLVVVSVVGDGPAGCVSDGKTTWWLCRRWRTGRVVGSAVENGFGGGVGGGCGWWWCRRALVVVVDG